MLGASTGVLCARVYVTPARAAPKPTPSRFPSPGEGHFAVRRVRISRAEWGVCGPRGRAFDALRASASLVSWATAGTAQRRP